MANVDFKNYGGAIGFQDSWMRIQGIGERHGLLKKLVDSAIDKGVNVVEPGSIHDRWGILRGQAQSLPSSDYYYKILGSERKAFEVSKGKTGIDGRVIVVNAQFVKTDLCSDSVLRPLLVIGGNNLPPFLHPTDVSMRSHDEGFITLVDQPFLDQRGKGWVEDNRDRVDGVVGHYGLARFNKDINYDSQTFAYSLSLPWVSGSGGKLPGQIVAYSRLAYDARHNSNEVSLLSNMRGALRNGPVGNHQGYASWSDLAKLAIAEFRGNRARARGDNTI